jgi:PAS domain S-box-containing protein
MVEMVSVVDAAGHLTYVNRAWERALGYTQTEARIVYRVQQCVSPDVANRRILIQHYLALNPHWGH